MPLYCPLISGLTRQAMTGCRIVQYRISCTRESLYSREPVHVKTSKMLLRPVFWCSIRARSCSMCAVHNMIAVLDFICRITKPWYTLPLVSALRRIASSNHAYSCNASPSSRPVWQTRDKVVPQRSLEAVSLHSLPLLITISVQAVRARAAHISHTCRPGHIDPEE